jgi:hypothetical protein
MTKFNYLSVPTFSQGGVLPPNPNQNLDTKKLDLNIASTITNINVDTLGTGNLIDDKADLFNPD